MKRFNYIITIILWSSIIYFLLNQNISTLNNSFHEKTNELNIENTSTQIQSISEQKQSIYIKYALTFIIGVFAIILYHLHINKLIKKLNKQKEELDSENKILLNTTESAEKQQYEFFEQYEKYYEINERLNEALETVSRQKQDIEIAHKHIQDSINYASRIQTAVLPSDNLLKQSLPDHFVLFKPCQVVSGDFYWMQKINDYILIAAADCTGHGVPGAFMSMLGISFLNEIVLKKDVQHSNQVLDELRNKINHYGLKVHSFA